MKRVCNITIAVILLSVVMVLLMGCGDSSGGEVPDSLIAELVAQNDYAYLGDYTWSTIHHVDKETHRDRVDIFLGIYAPYAEIVSTCSAVYEYDRSSDLWTLVMHDNWTEPEYNFSFNDALVGEWSLESNGSIYKIAVTEVFPAQISIEFSIKESVYAGLDGHYMWEVSGYGTYDLNGNYFEIPLELPKECYVSWKDTKSGENESVTYLNVWISPMSGLTRAYISPEIRVW